MDAGKQQRLDEADVLSVAEAGKRLGLGRASAYSHAKAGTIPTIKLGNRMVVPKAKLDQLIRGGSDV